MKLSKIEVKPSNFQRNTNSNKLEKKDIALMIIIISLCLLFFALGSRYAYSNAVKQANDYLIENCIANVKANNVPITNQLITDLESAGMTQQQYENLTQW